MRSLRLQREHTALLLGVLGSAEGCAAVEGIFKAGVWVGVLIAVVIVGAVLFLFTRVTR